MFIASSLPAQQRIAAGKVSLTIPAGWRAATRAEMASSGETPPTLAVVRADNATVAVLESPIPAEARAWPVMQIAGGSVPLLLLASKDASVATPLHETKVAGLPAAEWIASYATAKPDDSRARVIVVLRGETEYTLVASGPAENRSDIDAIVKSFELR